MPDIKVFRAAFNTREEAEGQIEYDKLAASGTPTRRVIYNAFVLPSELFNENIPGKHVATYNYYDISD